MKKISIYNVNKNPIGCGGMGNVYLGYDPQGNKVAIKYLSTFIDDNGHKHYEGKMRVGGTQQYLFVDPILANNIPTGEYNITFKVGSFEISTESSKINGELVIQKDEHSLDRTRITPTGTYYEHRNYTTENWFLIAKQETRGLQTQSIFSEQSLVISNSSITERRLKGFDIGIPFLSSTSEVYHFDTDFNNQNQESNITIAAIETPVLVDENNNNPNIVIDFKPAILSVSPFSEIGKSLYGNFTISSELGSSNNWTVDFWIQYIWAENQTIFEIGNQNDKVSIVISTGEPNYNNYGTGVPYNTAVKRADTLCYNVARGADQYIYHRGLSSFEVRKFSELEIEFKPNSWIHIAVILSPTQIIIYLNTIKVEFNRYSTSTNLSTATINQEKNSLILDELMIDRIMSLQFNQFIKTTENKIPWAKLNYETKQVVLDVNDVSKFHTNIFSTDIFKNAVNQLIQESQ